MALFAGAIPAPAPVGRFRGGRTDVLTHVVLHTCESGDTQGCLNTLTSGSPLVSAHYLVAPDGRIFGMVDEDDTAFHSLGFNARSIGVEVVGYANDPDTWNPQNVAALGRLMRHFNDEYGIPLVYRENESQPPNDLGIVAHSALSDDRYDPGPYFPWDSVYNAATREAGKGFGLGLGLLAALIVGAFLVRQA